MEIIEREFLAILSTPESLSKDELIQKAYVEKALIEAGYATVRQSAFIESLIPCFVVSVIGVGVIIPCIFRLLDFIITEARLALIDHEIETLKATPKPSFFSNFFSTLDKDEDEVELETLHSKHA